MSRIKGVEACQKALDKLLDEIEKALKQARKDEAQNPGSEDAAIEVAIPRLIQFQKDTRASNPLDDTEVDAIRSIDLVARQMIEVLRLGQINDSIAKAEDSGSDLAEVAKEFESEAAKNVEKAKSIRLTGIREKIEEITGIVDELQDIKKKLEDLGDASEGDVVKKIESLAKALKALKNSTNQAES